MDDARPLYVDVGALLDGGLAEAPKPTVLQRADGVGMFYAGQVNCVFGDPEAGKTWIALAAAAEQLKAGGSALVIDLDHNGAPATIARLLDMGVQDEALREPGHFRYSEPEDPDHLARVVTDASAWRPRLACVDSIGELLPLLGLSSNSPDDFTSAHGQVLKPLAVAGAAVIVIDHLAKNADSRSHGATGTAAKRRTIGGVSLRVTVKQPFAPGRGGSSYLDVQKDRHGGLRSRCGRGSPEPRAGVFELTDDNGDLSWRVDPPGDNGDSIPGASEADLLALDNLDPPPSSQRDVKDRLHWGSRRAQEALRAWRARSGSAPEEQGAA